MNSGDKIYSFEIKISGLVQGVGFRPFVYRIAHRYNLTGWVENNNEGVYIKVQGRRADISEFIADLRKEAPPASQMTDLSSYESFVEEFQGFEIIKSSDSSEKVTEVSPDIAVCDDCLNDIKNQKHRINYPFTNCTNCGPRFTIIRDLPYDRPNTTMAPFVMCKTCENEYMEVSDRRFHAQPVACNDCGPVYELVDDRGKSSELVNIFCEVDSLLKNGKVVAIKGIGGFQLACDAQNEEAVLRLREGKNRDGKPFAVMFRDIETLEKYAIINNTEKEVIKSWRRPIVILDEKKPLASSVSNGFNSTGAMLPYMPFHYLMFEATDIEAVVMTSGNISDEPIVIDNNRSIEVFKGIADAVLTYNRDIHNRTDDSVAFIANNHERLIRRSRGYAPSPVSLDLNVDGIFAAGAELVNCFCLGKGQQAFLSQHIGDLKNLETLEFYTESFERSKRLFRVQPVLAAYDLHPDYLSSRFAQDLGIPLFGVQHHHAHIVSCMGEYRLDEDVIGVAMDGTGLGTDGNIWGGEFLICNLHSFTRFGHFEYIPLPGGDSVTKEPWRTGLSMLYGIWGNDLFKLDIPFVRNLNKEKASMIIQALKKGINTPLSSGAGRVFDGIAAILDICTESKFHAEAPMRLQSIVDQSVKGLYSFEIGKVVSFKPVIEEIVWDLEHNVRPAVVAAKFHNTIVDIICEMAEMIRKKTSLNKVVLSGGTFQNRIILEKTENWLKQLGFEVYSNKRVPSNDGGIALGQLIVAAKQREMNFI
ncbi:MAG: carbamoyltransferase HypF [Bacteroidales bacterium]|nr:carbamoyltransferase HypF [Bacteroidales bacterium]